MSRLVAIVVDGMLLTVVVPVVVLGPPQMWESLAGPPPSWFLSCFKLLGTALPAVYFALAWWTTGQTLGGMVLGIAVRRADGGRAGLFRSVLRAVIGLLLAPLWFAGMLVVLSDVRRRALHDVLFGTVVLRRPIRAKACPDPSARTGELDAPHP
ncbi:RDD family protein [Nonomuraea rosea]|uniref:RDD family protein n=1 Tax=Nonomuraea rosea TaxID=638574 RepID=UPI0031F12D47